MDPITLATITSAVTVLATEAGKASASEAGKSAWAGIKRALGWTTQGQEPKPTDLPMAVATRLRDEPDLAKLVLQLLQATPAEVSASRALVERIDAKNVMVISGNVSGVVLK
jgi:hypothetical protein